MGRAYIGMMSPASDSSNSSALVSPASPSRRGVEVVRARLGTELFGCAELARDGHCFVAEEGKALRQRIP